MISRLRPQVVDGPWNSEFRIIVLFHLQVQLPFSGNAHALELSILSCNVFIREDDRGKVRTEVVLHVFIKRVQVDLRVEYPSSLKSSESLSFSFGLGCFLPGFLKDSHPLNIRGGGCICGLGSSLRLTRVKLIFLPFFRIGFFRGFGNAIYQTLAIMVEAMIGES